MFLKLHACMFITEWENPIKKAHIHKFLLYFMCKLLYNKSIETSWRPTERNTRIMNEKMKDEKLDLLFQSILSLASIDECYNFFEDLCTVPELQEMSRRLYAAKLLSENCIYNEIAEKTGLSTATISRVNRCLKYGADGYATILARLKVQAQTTDAEDTGAAQG